MNANSPTSRACLSVCARVLAGLVTGLSAAVALAADGAENPANTPKDRAWVEKRVAAWQPTEEERTFEEIGWADGLLEAERLAKERRRGIFLFTYDGASLAGYRC